MKRTGFIIFIVFSVAIVLAQVSFSCFQSITNETFFSNQPEFIAKGFDFPVGTPNAVGYYNAQKFGENNHLGDDWNGTGADDVFSIANGLVSEVYDAGGGWGNVVRIVH